jgi:glycosyltransferase involved in cell wall biosynthesis
VRIGVLTNYHLEQVGGAEEALDCLATKWFQAGHDVVLFSAPPRRRSPRRPWDAGYRRVRLGRVFSTRFGLGRFVAALRREHAGRALDVLLACDAYWAGHVARMFCQRTGVPYVICSQGGDVMHGSRFLSRPVVRERMSLAIRDAGALACISTYIRERLEELATPRGILRLLPNGWPGEWSDRHAGQRRVAGRYVLGMGRIVELKGFQTLVTAFAKVRAKHPQASLVIAGDGNYRPQLWQQAEQLGLEPTRQLPASGDRRPVVCLPGFVHGDEKLSLVQHATVAVSPSIRQEPMSLVLFEMLCCGVPVVGSRVGGTPDIVQPGVNGELFSAGDAEDLAGQLDRLLTNEAERDRLARQAAPSVEAYRWSRIAPAYLELFAEVIAARRRAPVTTAA